MVLCPSAEKSVVSSWGVQKRTYSRRDCENGEPTLFQAECILHREHVHRSLCDLVLVGWRERKVLGQADGPEGC